MVTLRILFYDCKIVAENKQNNTLFIAEESWIIEY